MIRRTPTRSITLPWSPASEGQFQQGIDLARRSLAYRPRQARAHNLIGQALHRMGQIKDALESFDTAIACDANFADAYGNRANMLSELGRNAEALSSFDRALALEPQLGARLDQPRRHAPWCRPCRRRDRKLRQGHRARPGLLRAPLQPGPRVARRRAALKRRSRPTTARWRLSRKWRRPISGARWR